MAPRQSSLYKYTDTEMQGRAVSESRSFLIKHKALVTEIEKAKQGANVDATVSFLDVFDEEVLRVDSFIESQQKDHELVVKGLLRRIASFSKTWSASRQKETLQNFVTETNDRAEAYLSLQTYAAAITNSLTKIANCADAQLVGTSCVAAVNQSIRWKTGSNSSFVVVLSDIYDTIRTAENQDVGNSKWVAPATFERSTTKFWIEQGMLTDLLLKVVTEAPLLVYGHSGPLTAESEMKLYEGDKLWNRLASTISSVYFDSPKMVMYKERIARHQGAMLFRVRWYGDRPSGNMPVFLELKTHYEKWINTKSVKERVTLREKDMGAFLSRTRWDSGYAETLVRAANPSIKSKALEDAVELLLKMHRLVVEYDLRPCVRSKYSRVAFQSPKSNDLRLTIDRNITVIDETSTRAGVWCLSDDAIQPHMIKHVPYDVFEVKLSGSDMPETIQTLKDSGVITEAAKFSKFLTGAAAFNAGTVSTLPYWAENREFAPLFNSGGNTGNSTANNSYVAPEEGSVTDDSALFSMKPRVKPHVTGIMGWLSCGLFGKRDTEPRVAAKRPARVEPKSYFANERTFIQWISAALLLVTVSVIVADFADQHPGYPVLATGLSLLACAALIVLYAVYTYLRRVQLLAQGATYGYVDHVGPAFLSIAIFAGVLALLAILVTEKTDQLDQERLASRTIKPNGNVCFQHDTPLGLSKLEYQPSDVLVDIGREQLLVPSLESIQAHSMRSEVSGSVRAVVSIPEADLEGLVYVGNTVFAISEKTPEVSELIALNWNGDQLVVDGRWDIPTPKAEGIAYLPGANGASGKLYIAGDLATSNDSATSDVPFSERGVIDVYDVPTVAEQTLTGRRLNSKLLNDDLVDSKISALQFFEGVLYILHDNTKVARAWDVQEGTLLAEWKLPRVEGNADKQWEGLSLERRQGTSNLRGSEEGDSLYLHLTLDSPPQVWSFQVEEGNTQGEIILPGCARA